MTGVIIENGRYNYIFNVSFSRNLEKSDFRSIIPWFKVLGSMIVMARILKENMIAKKNTSTAR